LGLTGGKSDGDRLTAAEFLKIFIKINPNKLDIYQVYLVAL